MNWLDIVIVVCIVSGIIHGLVSGIIKQILSLVAIVAAILLSGTVANFIHNWFQPYIQSGNSVISNNVEYVIYYVIAFIFIISVFAFAAKIIDNIINFTPAEIINKLFGAIFGAFMWVICLSIAFNILAVFDTESNVISESVKENSIFYEKIKMVFQTIFPYFENFYKN